MIETQRLFAEIQYAPQTESSWSPPRTRKACHLEESTQPSKQVDDATRRSRKRLRFSETSKLAIVPPKTDDEITNSWYNKRDLVQFKAEVRQCTVVLRGTRTAKAMKQVAHCAATKNAEAAEGLRFRGQEHIRGLEHMLSPDVMKVLFARRHGNVKRVLEEQDALRSRGEENPERLAKISMRNTEFTKEWARLVSNLKES